MTEHGRMRNPTEAGQKAVGNSKIRGVAYQSVGVFESSHIIERDQGAAKGGVVGIARTFHITQRDEPGATPRFIKV